MKFCGEHWQVISLFALFLLLWIGHAGAITMNRSPEQIKWMEEMIMMTFTAIIGALKIDGNNKP